MQEEIKTGLQEEFLKEIKPWTLKRRNTLAVGVANGVRARLLELRGCGTGELCLWLCLHGPVLSANLTIFKTCRRDV